MKKSKLFLKGLIGIPFGIFALEFANIVVSVEYGKYIRLDCLGVEINLISILKSYLYNIISSYILTVCIINSIEINNKEISILEKAKETNKFTIPLIILLSSIMTPIIIFNPEDSSIIGFIISYLWVGIAMTFVGIKCLLDKYTIKEINKKLKEKI